MPAANMNQTWPHSHRY